MPNSQDQTPKDLVPEKVLFTWKAPTRAFKKKGREFWVKLTAVVSLLGFIFFIAEGIMPVVLLVSVVFLFYILSSVEPEDIEYSITNKGVNISGKRNAWETIRNFETLKRGAVFYLVLNTNVLPGRLEIIIKEDSVKKIKDIVSKYIPEDNSPKSRFDQASDWISEKIIQ